MKRAALALLAVLPLAACLGDGGKDNPVGQTFASAGQIGNMTNLQWADAKDRQAFNAGYKQSDLPVPCPPPNERLVCHAITSEGHINSTDSNGSAAMAQALAAQSAALDRVTATTDKLVGMVAPLISAGKVAAGVP